MGRILFSRKRKIVTESRLAICQIRDNFAEKESRNPKDDTESKTYSFSKKKKVEQGMTEGIKKLGGNSPSKYQQFKKPACCSFVSR